jgi:hypothetical protein
MNVSRQKPGRHVSWPVVSIHQAAKHLATRLSNGDDGLPVPQAGLPRERSIMTAMLNHRKKVRMLQTDRLTPECPPASAAARYNKLGRLNAAPSVLFDSNNYPLFAALQAKVRFRMPGHIKPPAGPASPPDLGTPTPPFAAWGPQRIVFSSSNSGPS